MDHDIPEAAWGLILPETRVYEVLGAKSYYTERPEFYCALDHARENGFQNVLDIGCGSGIFLDMAKKAGLQTFGIELNQEAAIQAQKKGHHTINQLLSDVTLEDTGGALDFITLFQVLEHVLDPVEFLSQARALLKPGGLLFFSVPNDNGQVCLNLKNNGFSLRAIGKA